MEDIVEEFGNDDARKLLQEYRSVFGKKQKLTVMPAPIMDEEIEQSTMEINYLIAFLSVTEIYIYIYRVE